MLMTMLPTPIDPSTADRESAGADIGCSGEASDDLREAERRAVAGDGAAAEQVWRAHRGWVAAVLLAHKARDADLEDLLQDVALTFVRKVGSVRDSRALRGWLRTVAINAARAARRSGRLRPSAVDPGMADGAAAVPDHAPRDHGVLSNLARRDHAQGLLTRLGELPELYREPLLLRTVRGLSSRQVGDLLGVSYATVDTRVARARRMLLRLSEEGDSAQEENELHV